MRAMFRRWGILPCFALWMTLVGWIGAHASPNKTEVGHVAAAAYFWKSLRFDVFCVNPPLTRMITSVPIAICGPKYDWRFYSSRPQDRAEWTLGKAFIAANTPDKIRWCFTLARWSLLPVLLLGGYFGWRLSRELYGTAASYIFLTLWCFSPLLLAWGATICPDATAASLGIVAVYVFRRWLSTPDWTRTAIAGACLGLLPLTKLTWIVAFALWPAVWLLWTIPIYGTKARNQILPLPPFRQLAAILLVALYMLNVGYLFDGTFRPLGKYVFNSRLLRGGEKSGDPPGTTTPKENRFAGTWLGTLPVPLPADFVLGIDTQRCDFERGLPSYFRGQWADHGWWYYYLYALLIKEPLGTWCLTAFAVGAMISGHGYSASWRDEMVLLAPAVAFLLFVSSQTGFSAHLRYLLPALPFLFIWVSKIGRVFTARSFSRNRLVIATSIALMLAWSVASSLAIYPHSLSYFSELAAVLSTPTDRLYPKPPRHDDFEHHGVLAAIKGALSLGPCNGPRHLQGSNIDWGQDLYYLEDWCKSHPEARPIKIACTGLCGLDRSSPGLTGSLPIVRKSGQTSGKQESATVGPLPGWYALSVNEIYSRSQQYRYFLNFRPVAMAGYSIYIYHITENDANRVRKQSGLPLLPRA